MTFHEELLQSCPSPCGNMFGKKDDGYDARLNQAKFLSELMRTRRPFCFLRMGYLELVYLLAQQHDKLDAIELGAGALSGTQDWCNARRRADHPARWRKAYELA